MNRNRRQLTEEVDIFSEYSSGVMTEEDYTTRLGNETKLPTPQLPQVNDADKKTQELLSIVNCVCLHPSCRKRNRNKYSRVSSLNVYWKPSAKLTAHVIHSLTR
jgi:hypothetical protein